METIMAITVVLVLALFFFSRKKHNTPPMAPGAWPIFGHLHLFMGGTKLPYITLAELADKCGPIFSIRLGTQRAVVVSSPETIQECFTTHDAVLSSRPQSTAAKYLGYNYALFGFAPYGSYWREMRKMAISEVLSNRRIELLKHVRVSEVDLSIKDLYKLWHQKKDASAGASVLVELKEWFHNLTLNVILRAVAGKRYDFIGSSDEDEICEWLKALRDLFELMGMSVVSDVFPFMERLDIGGHIKKMKSTARKLDSVLAKWLEEHRRNQVSRDDDQQDFIDVLISATDGKDLAGYDADTVIKATCLNVVAAGIDPTTITMVWAISLLLNNPHVLETAQEELRTVIGSGRLASESDIDNLVYLQAVVKETLRLYPPAPISVARECIKDCVVSGYHVPKGTRLIPNLWKVHNDPQIWPDPSAFKPERFLTTHKDIDVRGQHFELLPFGGGRRGCPGTSFGLQVVHLALAAFLHAFDVSTPENERVDMTESFGMTNLKATPLGVLIKPRINIPFQC